jgi:hypothetical protein
MTGYSAEQDIGKLQAPESGQLLVCASCGRRSRPGCFNQSSTLSCAVAGQAFIAVRITCSSSFRLAPPDARTAIP